MRFKKQIANRLLILAALLMIGIFYPAMRVNATGTGVETSNIHKHNYNLNGYYNEWNWPSLPLSYMYFANGKPVRVEAVGGEVVIEFYSDDYELQSSKTIDYELPIFGGFYNGQNAFYMMFGQENPDQSDNTEVVRVVKYDKNWNRIGSVSYYGINTYIPFDAGSSDFAEYGNMLYIRTCHKMYDDGDGVHHQANMTFAINTDNMTEVSSYWIVMNMSCGYVSHSFNQFIRIDGDKIVAVDHGDAHPRSILIGTYHRTDASKGKLDYYGGYTSVNMISIPGDTGANYTGTSVGSFEISDKNYMVAASKVEYDSNFNSNLVRNVSLLLQPRGDFSSASNEIKITNYAEGSGQGCGNPYLVKVSDNLFVLMWELLDTSSASKNSAAQTGKFQAVVVDGSGNRLSEIKTFDGDLSDCKPVVNGNSVVWYTTGKTVTNSWGYSSNSESEPHFYELYFVNSGSSYTLSLDKQKEKADYSVYHWIENASGTYTVKETESLSGLAGSSVTPTVKSYTGYQSPATQTVTVSPDGDTKVDYYYNLNTYKLTWNLDGGSASGNYTSGNVKYQTRITAPQPVKKGYVFDGWDANVPTTMPAKNVTLKAKWLAEKVKLSKNSITCTEGDTITLKAEIISNSNAVSWSSSNNAAVSLENSSTTGATFVAKKAGKSTITVKSGDKSDKCVVTVEAKNVANEEQVKAFVTRFYTLILNREPDETGINYWTQILLNKEQTGAQVAFGFVNSPEFTEEHPVNDTEFVKRMYAAFFDRDGGADGEAWWLGYLNKGYTRNYVLAGFTNSDEFKNLCAQYGIEQGSLPMDESMKTNPNPSPQPHVDGLKIDASNVDPAKLDEYIDRLYRLVLKREPEADGKQYWREEIIKGNPYNASTAAEIGFFNSPEYLAMNKTDEEFIMDCYLVFLNREAEESGFEYWKEKFRTGEYDRQKLIEVGVGHSNEFKDILRSYGFVIIE